MQVQEIDFNALPEHIRAIFAGQYEALNSKPVNADPVQSEAPQGEAPEAIKGEGAEGEALPLNCPEIEVHELECSCIDPEEFIINGGSWE